MVARFAAVIILFARCDNPSKGQKFEPRSQSAIMNRTGSSVLTRISPPAGAKRVPVADNSFGHYLRNLPLQPDGSKVHYYNGQVKQGNVYAAIIKMDVGKTDLQQCADAVMRLRAEYLYAASRFSDIHFKFTNGFEASYAKWREGYRIKLTGNNTQWIKTSLPDAGYESFRNYLNKVFTFSGTLSLSKELTPVRLKEMQPGDVLIRGGSPGHAVIIMDMAVTASGKKYYLIAQSYMPAQEIHILNNPSNDSISPWYELNEGDSQIETPEWTFKTTELKRFP
jgi:hypothetical protein